MRELSIDERAGEQREAVDWAAWLDEYGPRLLLYARQQSRSEADAEDVLQMALVQLVRAVEDGRFKGEHPAQWLSYAHTAVRHLAADRGRRSEVSKRYEEQVQDAMSEEVEDAPWLCCEEDQEYVRRRVEKLLRILPKEYAEVVILKIWSDYTFQQIADMTNAKLSTVASRYRYAMKIMRKQLENNPI